MVPVRLDVDSYRQLACWPEKLPEASRCEWKDCGNLYLILRAIPTEPYRPYVKKPAMATPLPPRCMMVNNKGQAIDTEVQVEVVS